MSSHTLNAARAAFVLVAIAANGMPSHAFAGEAVRTERVVYTDLDLKTEAGVATLDRRLSLAIRRVCYNPNSRSTWDMAEESHCRDHARDEVRSQREVAIASARSESRFASAGTTMGSGVQVADRAVEIRPAR
ncbi:UrcA family protein [Novosphingobium sp. BL-8A]|uniref:UrcA family protein n=1 Tax=Novosphingobium sp. BL-8A TaxID=3127639 RepID=UPI003757B4CA